MSFFNRHSFLSLSTVAHSWNLEMRTIELFGTLMFNSASDFIALEMIEGRLRFLVGKGSNVVELMSDRNVSDGKWHNVSLTYTPFQVEVSRLFRR